MKQLALARLPLQPQQFFHDLSTESINYQVITQDVYNDYDKTTETSTLRAFERQVAEYLGKEDGLFLPSGVMAQNIVLAMAKQTKNNNNFLVHWSSHLLIHEFDAYQHLFGMNAITIPPDTNAGIQEPFTYANFLKTIELNGLDVNNPALAVVFVELPHREVGGKITSWEDLQKISSYCKQHQIHLQMDGARLWEASAAYSNVSIHEITSLFDSVYVSFYKGIGAITGAMLLGKTDFLIDSRIWLRRLGGNLYSHLPYYLSCLINFHCNKDAFHLRKQRFVEIVQHLTSELLSKPINFMKVDGEEKPIIFFDPPIPVVSLIHVYLRGDVTVGLLAIERAAEKSGISCFFRLRPGRYALGDYSYTEINLGPHNFEYTNEDWLIGYERLLIEIRTLLQV